jgi:hypothetical protein
MRDRRGGGGSPQERREVNIKALAKPAKGGLGGWIPMEEIPTKTRPGTHPVLSVHLVRLLPQKRTSTSSQRIAAHDVS